MNSIDIDRAHAVPLYHQIYLMLRDEIVAGTRAFGSSIPTEREIAEAYSVSRITARRALSELAQEGFVERRRRTGTRVTHRPGAGPIEANIDQAVETLLAFGRGTTVRVIELRTCPATDEVAALLALEKGEPVVRAVRVRSLRGEALGEVVSYVPAALGLALGETELTGKPMLALLSEAGHTIGAGSQTVSAGSAGGHLAALLGVDMRAPVIKIERTIKDKQGRPLLFTSASYRADRYRITIDLQTAARLTTTLK